ncbi:ATP-grasp domain-containing protein [Rhodohalobacter sp. 8-1]|uniref:ATP-grasp domain-containing protein n=1 Tax=Rhodohalobacter sp. 8-1 TaxID=3131972 RepID=UPI0030EE9BD6
MTLGILTSFDDSYKQYITSCEDLGIDYEVIDFKSDYWLKDLKKGNYDGLLVRPPSQTQEFNTIYMERLYFIHSILGIPMYPSYDSLFLYENKRVAGDWLEHFGFPHLKTHVFQTKEDATDFISRNEFPLVFKTNIGSSATGVDIVKNKSEALTLINRAFGRFSPFYKYKFRPSRLKIKLPGTPISQRNFVIIQQYVDIKWEWRLIKIGNSFFGRRKLLKNGFASGSKLTGWGKPPDELLFMIREISEKQGFRNISIDFFETTDDNFLVNEVHALFGTTPEITRDESELYIDGKPGRLVFKEGKFIFEEGFFNQNLSYLLRVEDFVKQLSEKNE